jgi:hypothetical protein
MCEGKWQDAECRVLAKTIKDEVMEFIGMSESESRLRAVCVSWSWSTYDVVKAKSEVDLGDRMTEIDGTRM